MCSATPWDTQPILLRQNVLPIIPVQSVTHQPVRTRVRKCGRGVTRAAICLIGATSCLLDVAVDNADVCVSYVEPTLANVVEVVINIDSGLRRASV